MDEKIFDPVQLLLRANNATIASQAFRIVKLETDREEQQQMFLAASREISELQMLATNIERRAEEAETALAAMTAERDALRDVAAKFEREYENGFPAHATGSIGGTGHPIGSCADCGACRLHAVYEKAQSLARAAVEGER